MYTNGFDIAQVLPELKSRLGWRQPAMSGSPILSQDNLLSKSNRYFDSFHSLVTLNNIKGSIENPNATDEEINDYLSNLQEDAIIRCLSEVFRDKNELIEQKLLYTRWGMNDLPVDNQGLFVGYILTIGNAFDISTVINSATLYFDKDCTVTLHLFMDGVKEPLKTAQVNVTAWQRTYVTFDEDFVLPFKRSNKFYFGYFQDEIITINEGEEARAIREQVSLWATPMCFEYIVMTAPKDDFFYFNHNYRMYGSLPSGLNLEISSFYDHTEKIMRKANLFDEAVGLTVASMVVEMISMSTRTDLINRQTSANADRISIELSQAYPTSEMPVTAGLRSRLISEYKRLKNTFFPKAQAGFFSQLGSGRLVGSEKTWSDINYKLMTNPPFQKP